VDAETETKRKRIKPMPATHRRRIRFCFVSVFVLHVWAPLRSAAEKIVTRAPYLTDTQDTDGATPLHVAALGGHFEVADVLIRVVSMILVLLSGNQSL
jgi:ankyrin repeat protein